MHIQLNTTNVTTAAVGATHGLDLGKEYATHAASTAQHINDLFAKRNQDGGWSKWLALGDNAQLAADIKAYADKAKGQYDDMVVLGIGGSSLGGLSLLKGLLHAKWNELPAAQRNGRPRYHFIENVDSDEIAQTIDLLDLKRTLVVVISKSGTTIETMGAYFLLKDKMEQQLGAAQTRQQIVAITDKQKGILRDIANQEGYTTFEVPDDVGGRFSVFSAVGLLPAALCGIDVTEMQRGIKAMEASLKNPDIHQNPAAQNALIHTLLYKLGKPIHVMMPYSSALKSVAAWFVQLWAESLGKRKDLQGNDVFVGPTPMGAVGATDQHSVIQLLNEGPNDKVITFIEVAKPQQGVTIPNPFPGANSPAKPLDFIVGKRFDELMSAELEGTRQSLADAQRPNVTITLPEVTPYTLAQLLYFLEVQTALAGAMLGVDPFDQPGVEAGKVIAKKLLSQPTPASAP